MSSKINSSSEMHPQFPSGEWEGFYVYGCNKEQHKMAFSLNFKNNVISGSGGDDVGSFIWKGSYNIETMTCNMTKYYTTHQIKYNGNVDENGIWGRWVSVFDIPANLDPDLVESIMEHMKDEVGGGFHIWPKSNEVSEQKKEEYSEILANPLRF